MPIKERDIVLQGREGGEDTIDLPITRLGNVESGAQVKEEPSNGDMIPIIDSGDNEQMKKFPAKVLVEAKETAERALLAVQRVAYVIDTVPYQTAALNYTGEEQSPVWGAFDSEKLEIGGTTEAVDAGEYEVTFTPKGDYVWADESTDVRTVKWSIGRVMIPAIPSVAGSLVYTGAEQSPEWSGYDGDKMEMDGETSGVNAGSYTATFTPKANYQWADGTTEAKSVNWSIGKAVISTVPTQSGSRTYTGAAQSPAWSNYDSNKLTLGGVTAGTNAGSYTATFTPKDNYCWNDGTSAAKTVNWTIGKAAGSLTLDKTSLALGLSAMTGTITVTRAGDGTITASSNNTGVATVSVSGNVVTVTAKANGNATITVSVGAGTNHNAPANKTCSVSVSLPSTTLNDNSWAMIRAVSDAGQAENYWAVGDIKNIVINGTVGTAIISSLSVNVFIIGFNHNSNREGFNKIHFQIGKIDGKLVGLIDSKCGKMNDSNTNSGGWSGSSMRKTLLGNSNTPTSPLANSLMAALPSDLRTVMKSVTKYSDNTGGGADTASYVTATTDYLFLLSEFEYHGTRSYANSAEKNYQAQYDYYKAGNSKVHYRHSNTATPVHAWCRSVNCNTISFLFCLVRSDGSAYGSSYAYDSNAMAPAFCV